jgi:transposase InsO family protein
MNAKGASVQALCGAAGISRQAFYQARSRCYQKQQEDLLVVTYIQKLRATYPTLGGRKLLYLLAKQGYKIGRDRFFALLSKHQLGIPRKRSLNPNRYAANRSPRYANLLKNKRLTSIDQAWISDITYLPCGQGFQYLCIVADAFSRRILGYAIQGQADTQLVIQALLCACTARAQRPDGLLFHSDRGAQYSADLLAALLKHLRMQGSMTNVGKPQENGKCERIIGTLKNEYGIQNSNDCTKVLEAKVRYAIENYNFKRPHMNLNFLSPVQFEAQFCTF